MPRKTKENVENTVIKKVVTKSIKKTPNENITNKGAKKSNTKKTTTKKATANKTTTKKNSTNKTTTNKASTNKTTTNKASTKKNSTKKTTNKKASNKKASTNKTINNKVEVLEYYDLPYRYNQTVVKILAQTPNTLFVYWDISDKDKENYIKTYGEYFFNNTKPVLIITNITKNYSFEIDINDFANSWYLQVEDAKCEYNVELGRKAINNYVSIPNNYLPISTSNNLEVPNDHILFEKLSNVIYFKNIKTNEIIEKSNIYYLKKLEKTYNLKEFYKTMYKEEDFDFDNFTLKNPSSSSSTFK